MLIVVVAGFNGFRVAGFRFQVSGFQVSGFQVQGFRFSGFRGSLGILTLCWVSLKKIRLFVHETGNDNIPAHP
jgi:hypothetical protein